jgi:hypothetical protein
MHATTVLVGRSAVPTSTSPDSRKTAADSGAAGCLDMRDASEDSRVLLAPGLAGLAECLPSYPRHGLKQRGVCHGALSRFSSFPFFYFSSIITETFLFFFLFSLPCIFLVTQRPSQTCTHTLILLFYPRELYILATNI